jgi:TldD protein
VKNLIRLFLAALLLPHCLLAAQTSASDPVLTALQAELHRSFDNLKKQPVPVYFLAYQLTDNHAIQVSTSFGALASSTDTTTRVLDIDLRVGDYKLDNTHSVESETPFSSMAERIGQTPMPLDNSPGVLQRSVWAETDRQYKIALEDWQNVNTATAVKAEREDKSADFSHEPARQFSEPEAPFNFNQATAEERARRFSAVFTQNPDVLHANVEISGEIETRRFVNSEGSVIRISMPFYRIMVNASTRASDGMQLPLHLSYLAFTPEGLPSDDAVLVAIREMSQKLSALKTAPVAEPYTGPAIMSGRASAVFFHEIFGHRVEGYRQKSEADAQTFKKQVNQKVLPDFLSVYSDPSKMRIGKEDLVGYYKFDDEGVQADRVTVVDKGVLKNFLMSRSPIDGFPQSNSHGRRQQGYDVAARQSNLIVESSKNVSRAELKKQLIAMVKAANKPYGLLFDDVEGGFTFTQRYTPNAFSVLPTVVYRIYPDGREELVRGLDMIGTPLIAFSKIVATDNEVGVFNGMCGAESGFVPVSAVSPGILVSRMEVQLKGKSQQREPVLPPRARSSNPLQVPHSRSPR